MRQPTFKRNAHGMVHLQETVQIFFDPRHLPHEHAVYEDSNDVKLVIYLCTLGQRFASNHHQQIPL